MIRPRCPKCNQPGLADTRGNVWCGACGEANPMRPTDRDAIESLVTQASAERESGTKGDNARRMSDAGRFRPVQLGG
jgi:uncharacterized Zn finger protein (UPF0148 family)